MKTLFRVRCRRPAYCLNRVMASGAGIEVLDRTEDSLLFAVRKRHSARVEAVLLREGYFYEVSGYRGLKPLFLRLAKRPFLILFVLLVVAGVTVSRNFVWEYTVRGNRFVNTATVLSVLRADKANGLIYKGSIDLAKIKRDVAALEGVSFASVRVEGNRLCVEIKESLPQVDPEQASYLPLISAYSAVVTKVVAESGTPLVKSGDLVQKGAVLVDPLYVFTEGSAPAPASGEVWGIVTHRKEVALPLVSVDNVATGERHKVRVVTLFGKKVGKEESPPYARYDTTERVIYRGIGVEVREKTYFEREDRIVYHDLDQEGAAWVERARRELLQGIPFCAEEVRGVTVTQKKVDNILHIVLYYTVEQRIDSLPIAP